MNNNSNRVVNETNSKNQKYNTLLEFAQFLRQNGMNFSAKNYKYLLK